MSASNPFRQLIELVRRIRTELLQRYVEGNPYTPDQMKALAVQLNTLAKDCRVAARQMKWPEKVKDIKNLLSVVGELLRAPGRCLDPYSRANALDRALLPVEELAEDFDEEALAKETEDKSAQKAMEPSRITVDLAKRTITYKGQTYPVSSEAALRWVKVLTDHPQEWIAAGDLKKFDNELDGCRTDRLKKFLPKPIRTLIQSKVSVGSRLCYDKA